MDEIQVTKQHMDALKGLADTNLKISEARTLLFTLREQETEYLVSREQKAVARVQAALDLSHSLVEETNKNYEIIHDVVVSVQESTAFVAEAVEAFKKLVEAKDKHYKNWERDIKNQETTLMALRNATKVDLVALESAKTQVAESKRQLREEKRKVDDDRKEVERSIIRLKEGRI